MSLMYEFMCVSMYVMCLFVFECTYVHLYVWVHVFMSGGLDSRRAQTIWQYTLIHLVKIRYKSITNQSEPRANVVEGPTKLCAGYVQHVRGVWIDSGQAPIRKAPFFLFAYMPVYSCWIFCTWAFTPFESKRLLTPPQYWWHVAAWPWLMSSIFPQVLPLIQPTVNRHI